MRNEEQWAPVPIRVAMGSSLIYHGTPKLFSHRGHENMVSMLHAMGVPAPDLAAIAAGVIEFVGGVSLVAGVKVRMVSKIMLAMTIGNLLLVARHGGFPEPLPGEQPLPGVEVTCFMAASSVSLALTGAGHCSFGQAVAARR